MDFSNEFLTEKQKLEDFLQKIEIQLNFCLEDFEKASLDKLKEINELIKESEPFSLAMGKEFMAEYFKFSNEFNRLVSSFNELKRFKLEVTLEEFLDTIQLLKKKIYAK